MNQRELAFLWLGICAFGCSAPTGNDRRQQSGLMASMGSAHPGTKVPDTGSSLVEKSASFFTVPLSDLFWTALAPTTSHLCYLSQISGDFSDGASVPLDPSPTGDPNGGGALVAPNSGTWVGAGHNCQATCIAWSNFTSSASSAGPLISDPPSFASVDAGSSTSIGLWPGVAFSYVTGVEGALEGGGEQANIFLNSSASAPNTLAVQSQTGGFADPDPGLKAWATSVFFGNPNLPWNLVRLAGRSTNPDCPGSCDIIGNVTTVGTFEWNVVAKSGQTRSSWMVPTDAGFCAFTQVSGQFAGGGEKVSITSQSGRWLLTASAQSGTAYAKARCMAYAQ